MPTPRQQAEKYNDAGLFDRDTAYDYEAGTPPGHGTRRPGAEDYAVNPTNPPEPAAPAKGLKR